MKREKRRQEFYEFAVIGGGMSGVCAAGPFGDVHFWHIILTNKQ